MYQILRGHHGFIFARNRFSQHAAILSVGIAKSGRQSKWFAAIPVKTNILSPLLRHSRDAIPVRIRLTPDQQSDQHGVAANRVLLVSALHSTLLGPTKNPGQVLRASNTAQAHRYIESTRYSTRPLHLISIASDTTKPAMAPRQIQSRREVGFYRGSWAQCEERDI